LEKTVDVQKEGRSGTKGGNRQKDNSLVKVSENKGWTFAEKGGKKRIPEIVGEGGKKIRIKIGKELIILRLRTGLLGLIENVKSGLINGGKRKRNG